MRQTKPYIKTKFETGDIPTQQDYEDLIDSSYNDTDPFDNKYYVKTTGNDSTAKVNDPTLPYLTIKAAALAAYTDAVTDGTNNWNQVYVFEGVYNESSIAYPKIEMFFEAWAIVYHATISPINDFNAIGKFRIRGLGRFYIETYDPINNQDAINFKENSPTNSIDLECHEYSSAQMHGTEYSVDALSTWTLGGGFSVTTEQLTYDGTQGGVRNSWDSVSNLVSPDDYGKWIKVKFNIVSNTGQFWVFIGGSTDNAFRVPITGTGVKEVSLKYDEGTAALFFANAISTDTTHIGDIWTIDQVEIVKSLSDETTPFKCIGARILFDANIAIKTIAEFHGCTFLTGFQKAAFNNTRAALEAHYNCIYELPATSEIPELLNVYDKDGSLLFAHTNSFTTIDTDYASIQEAVDESDPLVKSAAIQLHVSNPATLDRTLCSYIFKNCKATSRRDNTLAVRWYEVNDDVEDGAAVTFNSLLCEGIGVDVAGFAFDKISTLGDVRPLYLIGLNTFNCSQRSAQRTSSLQILEGDQNKLDLLTTADQVVVSQVTSIGGFGEIASTAVSIRSDSNYSVKLNTMNGNRSYVKDASVINDEGINNSYKERFTYQSGTLSFSSGFSMVVPTLVVGNIYTLFAIWDGEIFDGGVIDKGVAPTAPIVSVMSVENAAPNDLVVVFNEPVTATNLGYTFRIDAAARTLDAVSGSGTNTLTFTISGAAIESSDVLDLSYDSGTGDTLSVSSSLELASFTQQSVTNNISLTILFSDNFAGTVINTTTKWDITNPDSEVVFSQDDELILAFDGTATVNSSDDFMESQLTFDLGGVIVLGFDLKSTDQSKTGTWVVGLDQGGSNRIIFYNNGTVGDVGYIVKDASVEVIPTGSVTLDVSTYKTMKITVTLTDTTLSYWNGSSWTQIATASHTWSQSMPVRKFFGGAAGTPMTNNLDNLTVNSEDYLTQYP